MHHLILILILLFPQTVHTKAEANLVPQDLDFPEEVRPGEFVKTTMEIRNEGPERAPPSTFRLRLSITLIDVEKSDPLLLEVDVPSIPSGAFHRVTKTVRIPNKPGKQWVWLIIDADREAQAAHYEYDDRVSKSVKVRQPGRFEVLKRRFFDVLRGMGIEWLIWLATCYLLAKLGLKKNIQILLK